MSPLACSLSSRLARGQNPLRLASRDFCHRLLAAGVDYLVTNDDHLLQLDPYEGMRIVSMTVCQKLLEDQGLLPNA